MAKVKVVGDINFEFDVKFNQIEDITIEAKEIEVDGKKVYVGSGNIEKISPKSVSFILSRIEQFLKKNNAYVDAPLALGRDENWKKVSKALIENGLGFLVDGMYGSKEAVEEMLAKKMFLLSESGMRFYLKKYIEERK